MMVTRRSLAVIFAALYAFAGVLSCAEFLLAPDTGNWSALALQIWPLYGLLQGLASPYGLEFSTLAVASPDRAALCFLLVLIFCSIALKAAVEHLLNALQRRAAGQVAR